MSEEWTDERIGKEAYDLFYAYADHTCPDGVVVKLRCTPTIYCADLMRQVRDDMQAEIVALKAKNAELEARLQGRGEWEPLEDGEYVWSKQEGCSIKGDELDVRVIPVVDARMLMVESVTVNLPPEYRLCRRTSTTEGE